MATLRSSDCMQSLEPGGYPHGVPWSAPPTVPNLPAPTGPGFSQFGSATAVPFHPASGQGPFLRLPNNAGGADVRYPSPQHYELARLREQLLQEEIAADELRHRLQSSRGNGAVPNQYGQAPVNGSSSPRGLPYGQMPTWAAHPPAGPCPGSDTAPTLRSAPSMGLRSSPPEGMFSERPPSLSGSRQRTIPSSSDAAGRHKAVAERCRWLYLKGRLEGFEVLRPESIFGPEAAEAHFPSPPPAAKPPAALPSGGSATGEASSEEMQAELDMLYSELRRRQESVHDGPPASPPGRTRGLKQSPSTQAARPNGGTGWPQTAKAPPLPASGAPDIEMLARADGVALQSSVDDDGGDPQLSIRL